MTRASDQSANRASPSTVAPTIHGTADTANHTVVRIGRCRSCCWWRNAGMTILSQVVRDEGERDDVDEVEEEFQQGHPRGRCRAAEDT